MLCMGMHIDAVALEEVQVTILTKIMGTRKTLRKNY